MQITFYGAAETVTGSCYLLQTAHTKLLVDCGMFQGSSELNQRNEDAFDFNLKDIDFMILTHAHIDHSGRIPKLVHDGFKGEIFSTQATIDLCKVMLEDSAHIQEMDAEYETKRNKRKDLPEVKPLYTTEDAEKAMQSFTPLPYNVVKNINEEIKFRFNDAGHMLGSAIVELWINEKGKQEKIVFSGDLGNPDKPLLRDPSDIDDTDFLVMESTYGNRNHEDRSHSSDKLLKVILETLDIGGTLVIPSFAVGRTQELLYEINHYKEKGLLGKHQNVKVILDSPLAIKTTEIFKHYYSLMDQATNQLLKEGDDPLVFDNLEYSLTTEESKAINDNDEPKIIISASGMADAGRVRHHIKHNIYKKNCTILFVGYQAEGTLGRILLDGAKTIKLFGELISVNARIESIDYYSGHADHDKLIDWVQSFRKKPSHILLTHGEPDALVVLHRDLMALGYQATIAEYKNTFDFKSLQMFNAKGKIAPVHEYASGSEKAVMTNGEEKLYQQAQSIATLLRGTQQKLGAESKNKIQVLLDCVQDILSDRD